MVYISWKKKEERRGPDLMILGNGTRCKCATFFNLLMDLNL